MTLFSILHKIYIFIEVYLINYYFESHLIYKLRYYRQTIFNQLNITIPFVDIIGLVYAIVYQFYKKSMWCSINVMWGGCASISSAG